MAEVFLSHSASDAERVRTLASALNNLGIEGTINKLYWCYFTVTFLIFNVADLSNGTAPVSSYGVYVDEQTVSTGDHFAFFQEGTDDKSFGRIYNRKFTSWSKKGGHLLTKKGVL